MKHNFKEGDTVYFRHGNVPMTVYGVNMGNFVYVAYVRNGEEQRDSIHYAALISEKEYKEFHNIK